MANDMFNRRLGKRYAVEELLALGSLMTDPEFFNRTVERLNKRAADAPTQFAVGIREVLDAVCR